MHMNSTDTQTNEPVAQQDLEDFFLRFRKHTIGVDQSYVTPYGQVKMIYADWTASGRLYQPIEDRIASDLGPFLGNTHTETSITGCSMTKAYHASRILIKDHVGALPEDILIPTGSGMTGAVNKFQRILGFKVHERYRDQITIPAADHPVVFVTHMEHHSNQTSWLETIADVVLIPHQDNGMIDLDGFRDLIRKYDHQKIKIAAVTSCSNVTGIQTPYHEIARVMHEHDGLCFVDFACSAPYIEINMRPADPLDHLDAIYFSPHKFLGGPGTSGILVFKPDLYTNEVPDHPGGGTVKWTNPWGERSYINAIEDREDGGTPPFLQTIRVALAIKVKEEMGIDRIQSREHAMIERLWPRMISIPGLHVLAPDQPNRLPVFSFYIDDLHFNLGVKLLNDKFGIQVRGGCSCAGTYGHYLLSISYETSKSITEDIEKGILSSKAGWMRLSLHPIMTNAEVDFIVESLHQLALHHKDWARDYVYIPSTNEFVHLKEIPNEDQLVEKWIHQPITPL